MEDVKEMAMFLDRFIDQMHHAKEERFLFPKAVELKAMKQEDMDELVADHAAVRQLAKEIIAEVRTGGHGGVLPGRRDDGPYHAGPYPIGRRRRVPLTWRSILGRTLTPLCTSSMRITS